MGGPGSTPSQQPPCRHCSWPPVLPLPRVPTSMARLIFCSHFTELYKESIQHGGGGVVLFLLVLLVGLFNLIICKVMFLFLFTLFSSYLTSVWKNDPCNCTFCFCVCFLPPNNGNNKLPILCWGRVCCQLFPTDVTDPQTRRDTTSPPTRTRGWPQGATPTGNCHTCSRLDSLPHACLGPARCPLLILRVADSCPAEWR